MAGKKLPKDLNLASKINPADGFFTQPAAPQETPAPPSNEITTDDTPHKPNLGGRPPKVGLKNEQFTLTMNPELYEKLRKIAAERCGSNFSRLIDEAIRLYCRENDINLDEIKVEPEVLDLYQTRQNNKRAKRVK